MRCFVKCPAHCSHDDMARRRGGDGPSWWRPRFNVNGQLDASHRALDSHATHLTVTLSCMTVSEREVSAFTQHRKSQDSPRYEFPTVEVTAPPVWLKSIEAPCGGGNPKRPEKWPNRNRYTEVFAQRHGLIRINIPGDQSEITIVDSQAPSWFAGRATGPGKTGVRRDNLVDADPEDHPGVGTAYCNGTDEARPGSKARVQGFESWDHGRLVNRRIEPPTDVQR